MSGLLIMDYIRKYHLKQEPELLILNIYLSIESSIIDHFYTSNDRYDVELLDHFASDHKMLISQINSRSTPLKTIKMERRDWRKYNQVAVRKFCESDKGISLLQNVHSSWTETVDLLLKNINTFHLELLGHLAPMRVVKTRSNIDVIDSGVSYLKKRRDRFLKKFYKTKDKALLLEARKVTKQMKNKINQTIRQRFQMKANTPNQKLFWSVVKEISGDKRCDDKLVIKKDGIKIEDPEKVSNIMANFFEDKVNLLVEKTGLQLPHQPQIPSIDSAPTITSTQINNILKLTKRKKSCGIDNIPMTIVSDTAPFLVDSYARLFNMITVTNIPSVWKMALVKPLHKSGDLEQENNYRPISNLCSLEKVYEKVLLAAIEDCGVSDGDHQHGYKHHHSTATAMLTLQDHISDEIDNSRTVIVYSLDLSAAFDMLRADVFDRIIGAQLPHWLRRSILDFLSDRKCIVEVDGKRSTTRSVPLGCVQGSVLGPRLFNLYTSKIPSLLTSDAKIVSYADDSYVAISGTDINSIKKQVEICMTNHVRGLLDLGMIVNTKKTEIVIFNKRPTDKLSFNCLGETLVSQEQMKVLGVTFERTLDWRPHIENNIKKMSRITHGLKFLRKRLTEEQFIRATTSQYYGMMYYGSQVWLGKHTPKSHINKLTSLHYRLLRIAKNDWKRKLHRRTLDKIGRATPLQWGNYINASTAVKVINNQKPNLLCDSLMKNMYQERRKPGQIKFFSNNNTKVGQNSLKNRLDDAFKAINFDHYPLNSIDYLRTNLKKTFFKV